jgi:hypothetical protein
VSLVQHGKGNDIVTFWDRFHAIQALTRQPSSPENHELPLIKISENSSLDYSFFCTFDRRANARLLRERIRYDHDHNSSSPNATHYGELLRGLSLIAAAPLPCVFAASTAMAQM